jgi:cyclophilin family peptidyl-prolyl cis-trans isomerase
MKKKSSVAPPTSKGKWVQMVVILSAAVCLVMFGCLVYNSIGTSDLIPVREVSQLEVLSKPINRNNNNNFDKSILLQDPLSAMKLNEAAPRGKIVSEYEEMFFSNKKDDINDIVTHVVECSTTKGNITIDVRKHWAPLGAKQFIKLVDHENRFFKDLPFFRVCPKYITQFGIKYGWSDGAEGISTILDDPNIIGKREMDFGYVFFAGSGPNSRRSELVISFCELDGCKQTGLGNAPWETPFGTIRADRGGFDVLHAIEVLYLYENELSKSITM